MLFFKILFQWFYALRVRSLGVFMFLLVLLAIVYFFPTIVALLPFTYLAL